MLYLCVAEWFVGLPGIHWERRGIGELYPYDDVLVKSAMWRLFRASPEPCDCAWKLGRRVARRSYCCLLVCFSSYADVQRLMLGNGRLCLVPCYEFQRSVCMFHDGGATFHKIPRVDI